MCAGNWVPELVQLAKAKDGFGQAGKHSPWMKFEDLIEKDPDVIIAMPCGWDIAKTYSEMHYLTAQPEWKDLKAVRNAEIYLTDGNQYFNRPGPRIVESLEILAEILYPDYFNFGHRGKGWKSLEEIIHESDY